MKSDGVRIPIVVDAHGVAPGVDEAKAQIESLATTTDTISDRAIHALEEQTEHTHGLNAEQLGSLRTAHHLFGGIKEIAEGGTAAIAGTASEVRILGEVFEELIPGFGPLLIILSTLVSVGASMAASQEEHNEKLETGRIKADGLAESIAKTGKAEEDNLKKADEAQALIEANFKRMESFGNSLTTALTKSIELQKTYTEEVLRGQEAAELAKATTPEQQLEIKKRYTDAHAQVQDSAAEQKNLLEQSHAYGVQSNIASNYKRVEDKQTDDQKKSDEAEAAAQKAEEDAKAAGIDSGKDGKYSEAIIALTQKVEAAQKDYENLRKSLEETEGLTNEDVEKMLAASEQSENLKNAQHSADLATRAAAAVDQGAYRETLRKDVEKDAAELADMKNKLAEQAKLIEQLQQERRNRVLKSENDKGISDIKYGQDKKELDDRDGEAASQKLIDAAEAILKDKTKSAPEREKAAKDKANAEADKLQRKLDADTRPGAEKPLTPNEAVEQKEEINDKRKEGVDAANEIATQQAAKDAHAAEQEKRNEKAAERSQLDQITGHVEASGNKQIIAEMRQIVERDKGDMQKQLADLLAAHITAQMTFNTQTVAAVNKLKETVSRHIGSVGNGGGFQ